MSYPEAGLASIGVSFVYGSDPEKKYDEVVRELNVIRNSLPDGITLLRANRQNPAMTNIVLEHHRAGKLRVVAVTHHKRLAAAPELPTAVEQGFKDLVARNFIGIYAPVGLPRDIVGTVSAPNL